MLKILLLVGLLALQGAFPTISMNKEGTRFSVAFPPDKIIQVCLFFESQTEKTIDNGVEKPYTPTSCTVFMDNFKFVEGPPGFITGVEGPTPRTGYVDDWKLDEGEWKIWAEAQVFGEDAWVKSNTLTWSSTSRSTPTAVNP